MSELGVGFMALLPLTVAVVATAILWRKIRQRLLFAVGSLLSLLGVQGIAAPVAVGIFLPGSNGLSAAAAHDAFLQSLWVSVALVLSVGSAFVWWLSHAFRKAAP